MKYIFPLKGTVFIVVLQTELYLCSMMKLKIGTPTLSFEKPVVMGIVNATPDSFFSESRATDTMALIERVERMLAEGASIIDIGGYSTRPGASPVSEEEEWLRVDAALNVIRPHFPQAVLSVDTFRASIVARLFDKYGAFMVNDITAGEADEAMFSVTAKNHLPYIMMHMRGTPQTMQQLTQYDDVVDEVWAYLQQRMTLAREAGVEQIIIDPGFGFAKTVEQNYTLLKQLHRFCEAGVPVLAGLSRKSMVCRLLNISPAEALPATTALNLQALLQGVSILRVHDVKEAVQAIKMAGMWNN